MENSASTKITFPNDSNSSSVSWGAVIAGAFVAAALSLALLALGTGVGFSAVSPWANAGASSSAIGINLCAQSCFYSSACPFRSLS
jgi:hypothetical protein